MKVGALTIEYLQKGGRSVVLYATEDQLKYGYEMAFGFKDLEGLGHLSKGSFSERWMN